MLSTKWQKNFVALSEQQIEKTLKVNEVVDMEWKFGGARGLSRCPHPYRMFHGVGVCAMLLPSFQLRRLPASSRRSAQLSCSSSSCLIAAVPRRCVRRSAISLVCCSHGSHCAAQNVVMELSLPQFYQFLQALQAANRQCAALSS